MLVSVTSITCPLFHGWMISHWKWWSCMPSFLKRKNTYMRNKAQQRCQKNGKMMSSNIKQWFMHWLNANRFLSLFELNDCGLCVMMMDDGWWMMDDDDENDNSENDQYLFKEFERVPIAAAAFYCTSSGYKSSLIGTIWTTCWTPGFVKCFSRKRPSKVSIRSEDSNLHSEWNNGQYWIKFCCTLLRMKVF